MERKGPFSAYKDWLARKKAEEAEEHAEPTSDNVFWLMKQLRKPHRRARFDDPRGYSVIIRSYQQDWHYTGGDYASSNDAVTVEVVQPLKVEDLRVTTTFSYSFKGDDEKIFFETCVINRSGERISDLRMDYIDRIPQNPNSFGLDNWAHDSNDDKLGLGIGDFYVDDISAEIIVGSAFKVAHAFVTKGDLPESFESTVTPQLQVGSKT